MLKLPDLYFPELRIWERLVKRWKGMCVMQDKYGRTIDYMRISVTDSCNLRCRYCMPQELEPTASDKLLTFEEIAAIAEAGAWLGIRHYRLTGGEPLVRRDIDRLVRMLKAIPGVEEVTMTTNGVLLAGAAEHLKAAGLDGVNVSLDTLDEGNLNILPGKMSWKK